MSDKNVRRVSMTAIMGGPVRPRKASFRGRQVTGARTPGERWDGADPATLERVLFHLVQECAGTGE